jgi:hypothetical protein
MKNSIQHLLKAIGKTEKLKNERLRKRIVEVTIGERTLQQKSQLL